MSATRVAAIGLVLGTPCLLGSGGAGDHGAAPGEGSGLYGRETEGSFWCDASDIDPLVELLPADISMHPALAATVGKVDAAGGRGSVAGGPD